jgi:hypothetical protein
MLRILGSHRSFCDGIARREFLHVGALSAFGLGLGDWLQAQESRPPVGANGSGKAKSCILLYLYGSPSQLETFDVKPSAPSGIRGELGTIPTVIPSFRIGELLPETAKVLDRTTIVRSMCHPYPIHGVAYATSGLPDPRGPLELSPRDPGHWPFIGSVLDYLGSRAQVGASDVPCNIALPFGFSTRRSNQPHRAGPYGGFLGPAYDPIWTDFKGEGTKVFSQENRGVVQEFRDPYAGVNSDCRFQISAGEPNDQISLDRLDRRKSLLEQLERARRKAESGRQTGGFDRYREMAHSLLTSPRMQRALDLRQEPMAIRESYGMTLFGQAALVARRVVEAGGRFVSVFWDEFGLADSAWDTHYQHYPRMKDELCPSFDRAYSGLIRDLEARGMLDETAVLCISEHGRTPQLANVKGGGRDHWSRAYSAIYAGGGFASGRVVGKTDRIAGDVDENPVSPKDILATTYHLLGIDPATTIHDRLGRPLPIAGEGKVLPELLA